MQNEGKRLTVEPKLLVFASVFCFLLPEILWPRFSSGLGMCAPISETLQSSSGNGCAWLRCDADVC